MVLDYKDYAHTHSWSEFKEARTTHDLINAFISNVDLVSDQYRRNKFHQIEKLQFETEEKKKTFGATAFYLENLLDSAYRQFTDHLIDDEAFKISERYYRTELPESLPDISSYRLKFKIKQSVKLIEKLKHEYGLVDQNRWWYDEQILYVGRGRQLKPLRLGSNQDVLLKLLFIDPSKKWKMSTIVEQFRRAKGFRKNSEEDNEFRISASIEKAKDEINAKVKKVRKSPEILIEIQNEKIFINLLLFTPYDRKLLKIKKLG